MKQEILTASTEIAVRFCDVDALGIVWHGNYIKYFEDGREAFGDKYGLNFLSIYEKEGFATPLVSINCDYKKPLRYQEKAIVETRLRNCDAAKVIFEYKIFRSSNRELVATGESVQVFVNREGELHITIPDFFEAWKQKWGLL